MKPKKFTRPISFFIKPNIFEQVDSCSRRLEISVSEFIRTAIEEYLKKVNENTNSIQ